MDGADPLATKDKGLVAKSWAVKRSERALSPQTLKRWPIAQASPGYLDALSDKLRKPLIKYYSLGFY